MHTTEVTILSSESIEQFRDSLYEKGLSAQTLKAYTSDLTTLLRDKETESIPQVMFPKVAMRWLTDQKQIVAPKTTTRRLTSLKSFARWAGWGEPLKDYQAPKTAPGEPHPLPEGLDGVRRMLACADRENHQALIGLCGLAGLRVHEALAVRASDFNLRSMMLKVLGKGDKVRFVPISEELWDILVSPVTGSFITEDALVVGLHDRAARKVVTRLGERARLQRHVKSHDLRATFATELYNKTLDIRLVQIILGHSSVETTQVYTGVLADSMLSAVNKL